MKKQPSNEKLGYKLYVDGKETASGTREEMGRLYDTTDKVGHFVQILFIQKERFTDRAKQCIVQYEYIDVYKTSQPVRHMEYVAKTYFKLDGSPLSKKMNEQAEQKRDAWINAKRDASVRQFLFDKYSKER